MPPNPHRESSKGQVYGLLWKGRRTSKSWKPNIEMERPSFSTATQRKPPKQPRPSLFPSWNRKTDTVLYCDFYFYETRSWAKPVSTVEWNPTAVCMADRVGKVNTGRHMPVLYRKINIIETYTWVQRFASRAPTSNPCHHRKMSRHGLFGS